MSMTGSGTDMNLDQPLHFCIELKLSTYHARHMTDDLYKELQLGHGRGHSN